MISGVPFLDLYRMHQPLRGELVRAFEGILERSAFVNGPEVIRFEQEFSAWVGTEYSVGVASGLDAEVIGLKALGLTGSIVVPAMTFIATSEAVTWAGGKIELVDVDENGLIDLEATEALLKKGHQWILPVHLFGQMVDPERLQFLAEKYKATIFEDSCQSHGASAKGILAGTIGAASAFSFYPGKNLGALGDAGALCTNDPDVVKKAKAFREHGQVEKNNYQYEGYTSRLDNIQAAFLSAKLRHINNWNQQRIEVAAQYLDRLKGVSGLKFQSNGALDGSHVYHLFVVLTDKRERLVAFLKEFNIGFGLHYPICLHKMPCYRNKPWFGRSFPKAEQFAECGISLPIFPGITEAEIARVCEVVIKALS